MKDTVQRFINHFHSISKIDNITDVFTEGCCYWFAFILCSRFKEAKIMYDPVINHFVAEIENKLYDITGDVTDKYDTVLWETYEDDLEKERIIKHCIEFIE